MAINHRYGITWRRALFESCLENTRVHDSRWRDRRKARNCQVAHSAYAALALLLFIGGGQRCGAGQIIKRSLIRSQDLSRADIYYIRPEFAPVACLVMCPGVNGSGEHYLRDESLVAFSKQMRLALVGLSFASSQEMLDKDQGYFSASLGSGPTLLRAIDTNFRKGIPIMLYGFSGGAHFVSSFEELYPDRVLAFCAYTAAWWSEPRASHKAAPGIIVCGKLDEQRLIASKEYFTKGRILGKPWCWLTLKDTGHSETETLNTFVRLFFTAILKGGESRGAYHSIQTKLACTAESKSSAGDASWLPDEITVKRWMELYEP